MKRVLLYALLIVAGIAQAASLAWPLADGMRGQAYGFMQILSLAILAACVDRCATPAQAFRFGLCFASAWLVGSTWWLYISMHTYGGMPAPLAGAAVLLLSIALALIYGGALGLYRRSVSTGAPLLARVIGFAAAWTLAELVRGNIATGFPWGAAGYAHIDSVLRVWAPWVGVYGLGALAAMLAMLIGARHVGNIKPSRISLAVSLACGVLLLVAPLERALEPPLTQTSQSLRVALLQGNVAQDLKFGAQANQALLDYRDAMLRTDADLIVTPETALAFLPEHIPPTYWQTLRGLKHRALLMGIPMRAGDSPRQARFTNSVLGFAPGQSADYRYDKHHLVPFGEFVPPMFQWFVDFMHIPLGEFAQGALPQSPFAWMGQRISVNICFEDLFGEELAQSFRDPNTAPTLLLNVSNLAWFGNSVALDQHLNIARMRALELARPMLRATNTGATAWIDAQGQVVQKLPYETQGALVVEVFGVDAAITPYAQWVALYGLWPLAWAMALLWLTAAQMSRNSRHGQRRFSA